MQMFKKKIIPRQSENPWELLQPKKLVAIQFHSRQYQDIVHI